MQHPVTSKHIDGISDLVIWAPIKSGFIDAFENITYETRLKLTAEALHKLRTTVREHEPVSPFPDTAERILSLLNFRIGIAGKELFGFDDDPHETTRAVVPRRYMYLVATFDAPWEPYMRLIWDPLGPFLDLLLCNCDGYKLAQDSTFPEYAKWVRAHQLDSGIFYSTSGLTVTDQIYLSQLEKMQRKIVPQGADRDALIVDIAQMIADDPEEKAAIIRESTDPDLAGTTARLAFEGLSVLYQLTSWFPPDQMAGEGRLLLHATRELLANWSPDPSLREEPLRSLYALLCRMYAEPVAWYGVKLPTPAVPPPDPDLPQSEIQTGILGDFSAPGRTVTHGAFLLFTIRDDAPPTEVRRFLKQLVDNDITFHSATPPRRDIFCNISFTYKGLERLGLATTDLALFPDEFRLGLEERATLLGDVREHHPLEWSLPVRNWPDFLPVDDPLFPHVNLNEIHFAIQLRILGSISFVGPEFNDYKDEIVKSLREIESEIGPKTLETLAEIAPVLPPFDKLLEILNALLDKVWQSDNPFARLAIEINRIGYLAKACGIDLLGYEPMFRPDVTSNGSVPRDHFGFRDGISQPSITPDPGTPPRDVVPAGDLIVGYRNSRGDPAGAYRVDPVDFDYQTNGSFLVVRKMSQNRQALDDFVNKTQTDNTDLASEDIYAAVVGRQRDGRPLITGGSGWNDFDYAGDAGGDRCPLASHIRRANPRTAFQRRQTPRILRRGMTYGPTYDPSAPDEKPRGIMFMAYCASIAEQYEVIQRWLNGGNATRLSSAQNDPLTGIASDSLPRTFRFFGNGTLRRAPIPQPFVKLEWGAYFFVPARKAIEKLAEARAEIRLPPCDRKSGERIIEDLARLPKADRNAEWKRLLEDFCAKDPAELAEGPAVWAAIRDRHHGIYRVPGARPPGATAESATRKPNVYLVGSAELIEKVLVGRGRRGKLTFSSQEQGNRVHASFGDIYVAMDPGNRYNDEARATNQIVWDFSRYQADQAFNDGFASAKTVLDGIKRAVSAIHRPSFKLDLGREFIMPALGLLAKEWFGIPDAFPPGAPGQFDLGGWGWQKPSTADPPGPGERRARCPGDFIAPSRYAFYPQPGPGIVAKGQAHGKAIREASVRLVEHWRTTGTYPGSLTSRIAGEIVKTQTSAELDLLARNVIGNMIGMLPPMNGALRGILYEWLKEKTLWENQACLRRASGAQTPSFQQAKGALEAAVARAMCLRPAPDLLYRTVVRSKRLGRYRLAPGDFLILGLVSATHQTLEDGKPDVCPIFGGRRVAAIQPNDAPFHACPAQDMVMASLMGILAALLQSGSIKAQAAALIVEIGGYPPP